MSNTSFTIDQITRLREIERSREKRGAPGLYEPIKELIARLESGGSRAVISSDERARQAKVLWDKGFGSALNFNSFGDYFVTIPDIPEELKTADDRFPELVLVDARLGIVKTCKLLGVNYPGDDQTFDDYNPTKARVEKVYWIRAQEGKKNLGKSVRVCRSEFALDELGLTVHEGLALFAQYPEPFKNRDLDCVGSVHHELRDNSPVLDGFIECPALLWHLDNDSHDDCGSGSRRE